MDEFVFDSSMSLVCSQYFKDWKELFYAKNYYEKLVEKGVRGYLEMSDFRSICWKLFLKCLPKDPNEWENVTNSTREWYESMTEKFKINPRNCINTGDMSTDHPLSQSNESPWFDYFKNLELHTSIQQDVIRTFPEEKFFRILEIQEMMTNILFNYARLFPELGYRQGMHELLAPLIYVLHVDQKKFLELSKTETLLPKMCSVLNPHYIEHDAFTLFVHLMEGVEGWYISPENQAKPEIKLVREPFTCAVDVSQINSLGIKLLKIYRTHLQRHDPELFRHLEQMEIPPQIYGIRWLRLLFGREFKFSDVLSVWDAIFANNSTFDLVEYIFTSMLIHIRKRLLVSDYSHCLSIMMRYPDDDNVREIIDYALNLKDTEFRKSLFSPVNIMLNKDALSIPNIIEQKSKIEIINGNNSNYTEPLVEGTQLLNNTKKHPEKTKSIENGRTPNNFSNNLISLFIKKNNNPNETRLLPQVEKKIETNTNHKIDGDREMTFIAKSPERFCDNGINCTMQSKSCMSHYICDSSKPQQLKFCYDQMTIHLCKLRQLSNEDALKKSEVDSVLLNLEKVHHVLKELVHSNSTSTCDSLKHELAVDVVQGLKNDVQKPRVNLRLPNY